MFTTRKSKSFLVYLAVIHFLNAFSFSEWCDWIIFRCGAKAWHVKCIFQWTSMFRISRLLSPLAIPSDGWFQARNETCLWRGSKLFVKYKMVNTKYLVTSRRTLSHKLLLWVAGMLIIFIRNAQKSELRRFNISFPEGSRSMLQVYFFRFVM